ncbi:cytochrome-c peroxidase [Parahaliea maris]|uniref:Cytochrome-c peroxidase n=1 Tax=Parahaliea maris TaxID=2716870 RepID=A0A5C8ZW26_9GAMM|nr:cytochrome c peroxidase [Parahaliea maris]TXS92059.1 cytochrome-c peroxidase [Parahaliea maris]
MRSLNCTGVQARAKMALVALSVVLGVACSGTSDHHADVAPVWSESEIGLIQSLSLDALPPPPPSPGNAVADQPAARQLGERLFFDPRFSSNGEISCASCHQSALHFTDGKVLGQGVGTSARHTMSAVGAAYSPWQFWDGRRDSLWAQALAPLEDPVEHGGNRMFYVRLFSELPEYREPYATLFGPLPDFSDPAQFPEHASPLGKAEWQAAWQEMTPASRDRVNRVFANMGKAIAAYERTLLPQRTRFDDFARSLGQAGSQEGVILNPAEQRGLRLFISGGRCIECHNGPLFTNNEFHNTGVLPPEGERPDLGRSLGLGQVLADPFNCLGDYSDAAPQQCQELRFVRKGMTLIAAFRAPSLRNAAYTAPYMHKGQIADLAAVLDHYNRAEQAAIGHNEAEPLGLDAAQLRDLEAFLRTL